MSLNVKLEYIIVLLAYFISYKKGVVKKNFNSLQEIPDFQKLLAIQD